MHCKENLIVNVLKIILGEKDNKKVRLYLQVTGVCDSLWLKLHPTKVGETIMHHVDSPLR
jgi:hypothetical protein